MSEALMLASKQIVVVEDEIDILDLICLHLKKERYNVRGFLTGYSFMKYLEAECPSLLVLDLMLPDIDGFEICKQLRARPEHASIPIIIITARSTETDKVLGLGLGADDYMVKPFSPRELVARVKAVLRRAGRQDPEREKEKIEIGDLMSIDLQKYEVVVEGAKIDLTATEFRILQLLASKSGWVFSREKILTHLWGSDKMVLDRTVDVHIKHLREKMGKAGGLIKNMRGVGYKLAI
jgi:two-component system phosphate regulon response regulator PhoB/two-component system alkaline phosphatase synthesis response regulator PhoP